MAVDAGRLGSAVLELTTDQSKLDRGLAEGRRKTESWGRSVAGSITGAIGGAFDVLGKIGLASMGFQAIAGAATGLGETLGIGLNAELENVHAQLLAFTKDSAAADKILEDLRKEAATTPFAFKEMASAAASLLPASKQAGVGLNDLIELSEILAASNPEQGLEGAAFALREALSGDFVSIVERFNLPRKRLNELKEQGVPALEAVSIAMKEMGLDADLVSNLANTASGRWSTLMDTFDSIKIAIGKPIFEVLSRSLGSLQKVLDENMPTIERIATALGETLAGAIEGLIGLLGRLREPAESVFNVIKLLATGDFQGGIFGLEEDSPIIDALFTVRETLESISNIARLLITGDFTGGIFGLDEDAPLIDTLFTIRETITGLVSDLDGPLADIRRIAEDHLAGLADAFDRLLQGDIIGAIETFIGTTGETRNRLTEVLAGWAAAFVEWITPMLPMLVGELLTLVDRVLDIMIEQAPVIAERMATWIDAFIAWAKEAGPPLLEQLGVILEMILDWAMAQVPVLLELFLSEWLPAVLEWAVQALQELVPLLQDLIVAVLDWIGTNGPTLLETFLAEWLPAAIIWVAEAAVKIIPELAKLLFNIVTWLVTTGVPKLLETAFELGAAIVRGLLRGLERLGGALAEAIGDALRGLRIDIGPFHLSAEGFRIDAPTLPSLNPAAFLPGAQHGLDFTVGGAGGVDSQLVAFRATPGERILAIPPGRGGVGRSLVVQGPLIAANIASGLDVQRVARQVIGILEDEWAEADDQGGVLPAGLVIR